MIEAQRSGQFSRSHQIRLLRLKITGQQLIVLLSVAGLLLVSLIPRLFYIQLVPMNYDEGHWLMFGTLAALGHQPYTETFVGIPPLALLTIQAGVSLFGSMVNARYPMMLYSLIGVVSIFWLVKQQAPRKPLLAGLLAGLIVSFGPRYLPLSGTILAEVPALAMALLSLVFIQLYQRQPSHVWLFLSGVVFALSLALKIFIVFLPVIIGLQLLQFVISQDKEGISYTTVFIKLIKMGLVWLSGILVVVGCFSLTYNPTAMYREVIQFRTVLREVTVNTEDWLADNGEVIQDEAGRYLPLATGAGLKLWLERRQKRWKEMWIWLLWLIMAALLLPWHIPLRPRHLVILIAPLAALNSFALIHLLDSLPERLKRHSYLVSSIIIISVSGYLLFEPVRVLASPQPDDFDAHHVENLAAVTFVQRNSAPDDCIVVDDQRFAFQAGRLVPPFLSETSEARLSIGWLNTAQIIETADRANCAALVIQTNRFDIYTPDLRDAAAAVYSLDMDFRNPETGVTTTVYAVETNTDQQPDQSIQCSLGGLVTLKGVDFNPVSWRAGDKVTLSTYWLTEKELERDYKIFLHLKDAQGQVVSTFDHYPFELDTDYLSPDVALSPAYLTKEELDIFAKYPTTGLLPTRLWTPGNTLKETVTLVLPETLPPGSYTLNIGMYDETSQERLAVINDTSGENAIVLGPILVQGPER